MKLLIIISVIAYSYAEKLDNTYLPPENAATAGGAPGSLIAPGSQPGSGLSNAPSSFGQPSSFMQPSGSNFGRGPSQVGSQPGSAQPGQVAIGQYAPQQYNEAGVAPQAVRPSFGQGSVGFNQVGSSPVAGRPSFEQSSPGFNQAATLPAAGQPGFGQGSPGYNQAPVYDGQAKIPASYSGQSQPERARASLDRNAEILSYYNENDGNSYAYGFETSNGISVEESGVATNGVRAKGSFAYTGDDGQQYRVTYTADENGYLPQGDHLPTPPPIPEQILKSLEENARAAAAGTQEGAYNPNEDLGISVGPQQSSGIYANQGQSGVGYRPGQGSSGTTPGQQGLNQGGQSFAPQYGAATSTSPGYQGSFAQANQSPTSQYNVPGVSSSGIPISSMPSYSTQDNKSPASRYGSSIGSLSVSVPGQQSLNQNSGYQYNTPGSLTGPGRFGTQGSQGPIVQNPSGSGSYRPGSQTPVGSAGLGSAAIRPTQSGTVYGRPNSAPQADISSSQGNQNSGYNYNAPAGSSSSGYQGTGTQNYPSQSNQSPTSQYNAPGNSPFSTGSINRPQSYTPQTNQAINSQKIPDTQILQQQGGQSPSNQYNNSPSSGSIRPSGPQVYPSQGNQGSQYNAPLASISDQLNEQIQSSLSQRPQLGTNAISGPTGSLFQKPSNQGQDDGYQYNRPQTQFGRPIQTGSVNVRPSVATTPSSAPGSTSGFSGNNYGPSGPLAVGSTIAPNVFEPSGSINQRYPTGTASSGSAGSAPVTIGQGSNVPRPGQYSPVGPTTGPTGVATFPRPGSAAATNQPTAQNSGSSSSTAGSGPYQYNRPGTQGPSSGSQSPFGSQPGIGSTSLGQDKPGQVGSQSGFGPSAQDRPSQTGSPGFGPSRLERPDQSTSSFKPSGQERPTESFGGPRQPPSFSSEEGYKY